MSVAAAALTAGATVAGGLISSAAQLKANEENLAANAARWRDQVELANTAHQREVIDLYKAGLNPILSASGSGAAVPQLGAAQVDSVGDKLGDSVQSAARLAALDIPLKESQVALNSAQATNLASQNDNLKAQNDLIHAQADEVRARTDQIGGQPSTILKRVWDAAREGDKGITLGDFWRNFKAGLEKEHSANTLRHPELDKPLYDSLMKEYRSLGLPNRVRTKRRK